MAKFDFVIGNPPYQDDRAEDSDQKNYAAPVYHLFLDEAFKVGQAVEMIHPARFLFNAGSTPKAWNKKMLEDQHYKVLEYISDATEVFPNTDIKGGVAITFRDRNKNFGSIDVFTAYSELNSILHKVSSATGFTSIDNQVITRTAYRLTDKMHKDHPEAISQLSKGHAYDMSTNIFERLPQIFYQEAPNDGNEYISILGLKNKKRSYLYVRRDYVNKVINLDSYKIAIPKANGNGQFGEILTQPTLLKPGTGNTETFITIGVLNTEQEANNLEKYIKTKFARSLLGVLKITQDITPEKWKYVPSQNFSDDSDLNWSKTLCEIDQQLYQKYGLSPEEIEFIETNVKEME